VTVNDYEPVNLADFERLAATRLEKSRFDYIAGGADDEVSLADNMAAFRRWRLVPRILRDVSTVDTTTAFLGRATGLPVGIAPVAFQHFAHPDAELATARAAADAGIVFCLSTLSSRSIEEVADASGDGRRWFQLYVHRDRDRTESLVRRAADSGYEALVVTVDLPVAGNRERDRRNALAYPQEFGNFRVESRDADSAEGAASVSAVIGGFIDASLSWADVDWLRALTPMPLIVKGVLAPEDAALAVEHGAAGVIVSNHGGRQLDRVPASIDQLPGVVEAVAGRAEVYLDGGVRRGTDVLVALAQGARGVFIGRPAVFALAVGGDAGVAAALEILAAELRTDMALLGITELAKLDSTYVTRASAT
jgi:isopentenyl diphosphate isomerase/L-lactate dehydrogenase-like FMN-dependent dehydrogenase